MKALLNKKFDLIGLKKFLMTSATSLFLSDLVNVYYGITSLLPKLLKKWFPIVVQMQGGSMNSISSEALREASELATRNVSNMLFIFLVFHTLIYFLMTKKVLWSIKYAYGYCLSAAVLTLLTIPLLFELGDAFWSIVMGLTTVVYVIIFLGINHFRKNQELQNS